MNNNTMVNSLAVLRRLYLIQMLWQLMMNLIQRLNCVFTKIISYGSHMTRLWMDLNMSALDIMPTEHVVINGTSFFVISVLILVQLWNINLSMNI